LVNQKKVGSIGLSALFAVMLVAVIAPNFASSELISSDGVRDDTLLKGHFTFTVADKDGNILRIQETDNLVVNEGMECVSDFVFGTTSCTAEAVFQYLSVGTGTTGTVNADTALGAESGTCARVQDATPSINTAVTGQRTITLSSVFSGANCEGEAYGETAVHDASSSGNMLARALISPTITLGTGDTLTIDYDIVINNT